MLRPLRPLLVGFALWALAFIAVYGLQYLGCRFGWAPELHRAVLIIAYAVAVGILAIALALQLGRRRQNDPKELRRMGAVTTLAALAATAITLGPTLFVSSCL